MSLRFQADADLNFDIVKAVRQREPGIDFASSTDSNLRGIKDPELLERVAVTDRVLVTHDVGNHAQTLSRSADGWEDEPRTLGGLPRRRDRARSANLIDQRHSSCRVPALATNAILRPVGY